MGLEHTSELQNAYQLCVVSFIQTLTQCSQPSYPNLVVSSQIQRALPDHDCLRGCQVEWLWDQQWLSVELCGTGQPFKVIFFIRSMLVKDEEVPAQASQYKAQIELANDLQMPERGLLEAALQLCFSSGCAACWCYILCTLQAKTIMDAALLESTA